MKKIFFVILLVICYLTPTTSWSQGCAMCKTSASNLNEDSARGLNKGILYLAAIPLLFLGITGTYWYKNNKKDRNYDYEA